MTIGMLYSPGTASFQLTLLDDGKPYVFPAHSNYRFDPTFTSTDSTLRIEQDSATANLFHVSIPAGEKSTGILFNAEAVAPDGTYILAQTAPLNEGPAPASGVKTDATHNVAQNKAGAFANKPVAEASHDTNDTSRVAVSRGGIGKSSDALTTGINSVSIPLQSVPQKYSIEIRQVD